MHPKWSFKFLLKPGRWVFVPTNESVKVGGEIKMAVEACWTSPTFYYHLRSGGHVEAVKSHLNHTCFLHVDIEDFFGSINRSRVTRSLKNKVGYKVAREMAHASTVKHPGDGTRCVIPYGFVQSQIIASLCLDESRLGTYLKKLSNMEGVSVSVYVDDIIVSCDSSAVSECILKGLNDAAAKANFKLNPLKQEGPATAITAFNIVLKNKSLEISAPRFEQFISTLEQTTSQFQRDGITSYVKSVNVVQGASLLASP
jgi:hypothetical protein